MSEQEPVIQPTDWDQVVDTSSMKRVGEVSELRTQAGRFLAGGLVQTAGWSVDAANNAVGDIEQEARSEFREEVDRMPRVAYEAVAGQPASGWAIPEQSVYAAIDASDSADRARREALAELDDLDARAPGNFV